MLFTGLGRSVLGETVPLVWVPPSAYGLGRYSRPRAQFLPIGTSQPVNNIYILPRGWYWAKVNVNKKYKCKSEKIMLTFEDSWVYVTRTNGIIASHNLSSQSFLYKTTKSHVSTMAGKLKLEPLLLKQCNYLLKVLEVKSTYHSNNPSQILFLVRFSSFSILK